MTAPDSRDSVAMRLLNDLHLIASQGETPDGDGVPVNVQLWAEKWADRLQALARGPQAGGEDGVRRFRQLTKSDGAGQLLHGGFVESVADGPWVLYEDVRALQAEVARLRAGIVHRGDAVVVPLNLYDEINSTGAAWKQRAETAEAALREAGRDAERLDWLDGFAASSHFTISEYFGRAGKDRYVEIQDEDDAVISEAPTLRESIDKAMAWWQIKLREDAALNGGQDDA